MRPVVRILRQVLGWLALLVGVVGLVIPVFPSIPFFAVGALLLAPHVRVFRRLSAWIHKKYPRFRGPLRFFREIKERRHAAPPSTPESNPPHAGK